VTEIEVGFVVEGQGDTKAVPALFRRVAEIEFPGLLIITREVFRVSRDKLKREGELERTIELLSRRLTGRRAILITIDTEGEAPGCLGPTLLNRAQNKRADVPIGVALAHHMFENWFIASAESLAGFRGLPTDLKSPQNPEAIQGAKRWLGDKMSGRPYRETTDQEPLAKRFNLEAARNARSFEKFYREVVRLCKVAGH
jgi:hypothetical protein